LLAKLKKNKEAIAFIKLFFFLFRRAGSLMIVLADFCFELGIT
jgi:hypothetical protein